MPGGEIIAPVQPFQKKRSPWCIAASQTHSSIHSSLSCKLAMAMTPSPEDLLLIQRCVAQDRLAQKELYRRYCGAMYTLAFRMTNSQEDADEVLQDTFLSVFRSLDKFKMESTIGAWIKTILVRTALRKIKKKVNHLPIEDAHREMGTIDWGQGPIDGVLLEKAILSLPDGYRNVFVLVEVEGFSHKETADMLEISTGTTKSQLFHAKKLLQKKLLRIGALS